MKLKWLRLAPFGGFRDHTFQFSDRVTLFLGPNESGKSTCLAALRSVLFIEGSLTKTQFEKRIARYVPFGGDSASVTLAFSHGDRHYELSRFWRSGNRLGHSLLLGDGELRDDGEIARKIGECLPAGKGSVEQVLLSSQHGLAPGPSSLRHDDTVRNELSDRLRSAVFDAGGVSVAAFRANLDGHIDRYLSNWDMTRSAPFGGRGIENPHKKKVGAILEAHYKYVRLDRTVARLREIEEELASLDEELRKNNSGLHHAQAQLHELEGYERDVQVRMQVQRETAQIQRELDISLEQSRNWPVLEQQLADDREALRNLSSTYDDLEARRKAFEERKQRAELEGRAKSMRQLDEAIEAKQSELDGIPKVSRDELEKLHGLVRERSVLESQISAQELTVNVSSRSDTAISVAITPLSKETQEIGVSKGSEQTMEVSGGLRVDHEELSITVSTHDASAAATRIPTIEEGIRSILHSHTLSDEGAYQKALRIREDIARDMGRLIKDRKDIVGDLEVTLRELPLTEEDEKPGERIEDILEQIGKTSERLRSHKTGIAERESQLATMKHRHGSFEELQIRTGELSHKKRELGKRIDSLGDIPDRFTEENVFFTEIQTLRRKVSDLSAKRGLIREKRLSVSSRLGDESSEDLAEQRDEAKRNFERHLRYGQALLRVHSAAVSLMDRSRGDSFHGYEQAFLRYLGKATDQRYTSSDFQDTTPTHFTGKSRVTLDFNQLSEGTKDSVALALRLAIADSLLGDERGFLFLDDPFVDLDNSRTQAAVSMLHLWAKKQQLIITSCHDETEHVCNSLNPDVYRLQRL